MPLTATRAAALRFVPTTHEYFLGDRSLPSVTRVLTAVGLISANWYTEDARTRGQWVHEATALLDRGELDIDSAQASTPRYWPYVAAYQRFLDETQPDLCDIEARVHDETYGYAGTLDRTCFLHGEWSLIDLKTGGPERWHALQTAAYGRLRSNDGRTPTRYALYLRSDGTYRLEPFRDRQDERVFLSAVALVQWSRA